MTTTLYQPEVIPPHPIEPADLPALQEDITNRALTHVRTRSGDVWAIRPALHKKPVPLNDGAAPPSKTRVPFEQVESFGRLAAAEPEPDTPPTVPPPAAPEGHAGRAHAVLSASGAHRWIACPPSALLEAELPESTSDAAAQGTAAHELAGQVVPA